MLDTSHADRPLSGPTLPTRLATLAVWALQAVFAVILAIAAYRKFAGLPESVELFDQLGFGQWLRYAVGALELMLAVGLLIPRLAAVTALAAGAVMLGATAAELYVRSGKWPLPLALIAVAGVVAMWRRPFWPSRRP
ncbi:MAG TPA: DoxX family protein [Catenuloplanes sp.]|jgi:uncharacterized membrane protein YphA (DoxX/SURF4 family)